MDAFLQQQVIRSTADFIVIAAPVLGSVWFMYREICEQIRQMQQHMQKSDERWAENTKAIAEESKERHRQFYELLRKMDERQRTNS